MIEVKEYYCGTSTPTLEYLKSARHTCIFNDCIVRLTWFIEYNGWNQRYITKDTDVEKLNEELDNIVYPI